MLYLVLIGASFVSCFFHVSCFDLQICSTIQQRPCITPNGTQGYCTPSRNCPYINALIGTTTSAALEFVTQSICGYDSDKLRLFCCDIRRVILDKPNINKNQPVGNIIKNGVQRETLENLAPVQRPLTEETISKQEPLSIIGEQIQTCQTPNGDRANCLPIYNCSKMLQFIQRNASDTEIRFLRESKCGVRDNVVLVCCGEDITFRNSENAGDNLKYTSNILIPKECGIETMNPAEPQPVTIQSRKAYFTNMNLTLSNRIFGGNDTEIHEFPWLALLDYIITPSNERAFRCGGALITSRYVLTAAHCIQPFKGQQLVGVRLGEWNYNFKSDACTQTNQGRICAQAPIDVGIGSLHPHPAYIPRTQERYNDIALIRLERNVAFTSHISPICLPQPNQYLQPGEMLTISGWGLKNYNEETSTKQKVNIPVISISQCSLMFEKNPKLYKLGKGQFCAGGEAGKDSCTGDSGTPLMKRSLTDPPRWYIEGIVSFGFGCGVKDFYGIYTKVSHYVNWINQVLVP